MHLHSIAFKRWVKTLCLFVGIISLMTFYQSAFEVRSIQPGGNISWISIVLNNVVYLYLISLGKFGILYYWFTMCFSAIISGYAWLQLTPLVWMIHMIHFPLELYVFSYGAGMHRKRIVLIVLVCIVALVEVEGVRWLRQQFM